MAHLWNRWQRTKINTLFSSWKELLQGVPQVLVLGPLLFNIFLNDLFFILNCKVCNFADDITHFVCNQRLDFILNDLERNSHITVNWFQNIYM